MATIDINKIIFDYCEPYSNLKYIIIGSWKNKLQIPSESQGIYWYNFYWKWSDSFLHILVKMYNYNMHTSLDMNCDNNT